MIYHVLFIYCPHVQSEQWIEGHEVFEWDIRPVTWEAMQPLYRILKARKKARYLLIFAIKPDAEYQRNPHRCVYAKPKNNVYEMQGGKYGHVEEVAGEGN